MNKTNISVVTTIGTTTVANLRNLPTPWLDKSDFIESTPFGDILKINMDESSLMKTVAIEINGDITTGKVVKGTAEIGETVTVKAKDENGMPFEATGVVVDVLDEPLFDINRIQSSLESEVFQMPPGLNGSEMRAFILSKAST